MARWTASAYNWTPTAVADSANFTDSGYMALQGGSSTQRLVIEEVYMGGLASSSAPAQMIVARDSTVGGTLSGGTNAALDPSTAALGAPPTAFTIASTKPQRSSTLKLLALGFNAYGGVVRWAVPQAEGIGMLGNTASLGEISLSHLSSGTPGLMESHFIYEPL